MNNRNGYESELWKTLAKEGIADISQFHKPGFFDEVPLYSRTAEISFLLELEKNEADSILLKFAVKFLRSIVSYEMHSTPYFAAVTVWDFSSHDPIVPSIFVWSGHLDKLYKELTLHQVKSSFGKAIRRHVSQLHMSNIVGVFEDSSTTKDMPRVFIAPSIPPYPAFVPVYMFLREGGPAK